MTRFLEFGAGMFLVNRSYQSLSRFNAHEDKFNIKQNDGRKPSFFFI